MKQWRTEAAKAAFADAVRRIEATTAAEVVMAVRARSARWREAEIAAGAVVAALGLLAYAYLPITFNDDLTPAAIIASFFGAALLVRALDPLKRALVSAKRRREAVEQAARALFVERGIATTRARVGVLVYVSELEQIAAVVADVGIDRRGMGARWDAAVARLDLSVRRGPAAFDEALGGLGALLAAHHVRRADDVNELPDAPLDDAPPSPRGPMRGPTVVAALGAEVES